MHYKVLNSILVCVIISTQVLAATRPTREELEQNFQYGWSSSASLIFFGTVAGVEYRNDPKLRTATVEVHVRVDSLQRGVPGNSIVRVRIEDELQTYRWRDELTHIGETGIWFVHRVRQYEKAPPRAHLIRYLDSEAMREDPQFLAELMKYVIQDTVDQTIKPNILNLLTGRSGASEEAQMIIDLQYDDIGALHNFTIVEQSNNFLFNDHVLDSLLQVHRRIRIPGSVKEARIEVKREVL